MLYIVDNCLFVVFYNEVLIINQDGLIVKIKVSLWIYELF